LFILVTIFFELPFKTIAHGQSTVTLDGYFMVYYWKQPNTDTVCFNFKSFEDRKNICGDNAYYKNIGGINFISREDVDSGKITNINIDYVIEIQSKFKGAFLCSNPEILRTTENNDPLLYNAIKQNASVAEKIQVQCSKVMVGQTIDMAGEVFLRVKFKAVKIKKGNYYGVDDNQDNYLILDDKLNNFKSIAVLLH